VVHKQLLIVSHYPLFDQGLQAILSRQPGVEVAGVCRDMETAAAQAQTLRPDILVVVSEPEDARQGTAVSRESTLRSLKGLAPTLIQIDLADNSMQVYRQQLAGPTLVEMEQATLDDLVKAIQAPADEQILDQPKDESREGDRYAG
jgi:DNA-binding NarL/FixJ family response regulator